MADLRRLSSSGKEPCAVCHDDVEIYAIGQCDHHICFKCSTRMRVLCEQMYCAICRADMPKVVFVKEDRKFENINMQSFLCYRKQQIYFENDAVQSAFYDLISHKCKFCPGMKPLRSFHLLEQHMRREHQLHYCDICVNLKVFSQERKCYDRERLARHRRLGDEDDKSFKGHPLCELCDQRFLDRDELARHCRKEHYHCHFCETDGSRMEFFGDYQLLREHFREEHYLCEEGDCVNVQFTNAFRSDIDLKAHVSQSHSKGMKKAEARQARTIELDIQLAPRPSGRGRGRYRGHDRDQGAGRGAQRDRDKGGFPESGGGEESLRQDHRNRKRNYGKQQREEIEVAHAVAASLHNIQRQSGSVAVMDPALINHLSKEKNSQQQQEHAGDSQFEKQVGDFPTLDGTAKPGSDEDINGQPDRAKDSLAKKVARANNFSIQDGEMEAEDFPSLAGKGRSKKTPGGNSAVWNVMPEQGDFPTLSSQKKRTDTRSAVASKTASTWAQSSAKSGSPQTVRSQKQPVPQTPHSNKQAAPAPSWTEQMAKQSTKPQSTVRPTQAATVPSWMQKPSATGRKPNAQQSSSSAVSTDDFPSLSSIGNSLIPTTNPPPAPKLSVFRSAAAANTAAQVASSEPTISAEQTPKQKPASFNKSDFPTLGLGPSPKPSAPKGKWVSGMAEEESTPQDKKPKRQDTKGKKSQQGKGSLKTPSVGEQVQEGNTREEKSSDWEPAKATKTVRVAMEEKQGKEIESFVVQHTKNKKKKKSAKEKKPNSDLMTVNVSDKESDFEEKLDVSVKESKEIQPTAEVPSDLQALQPKTDNFPSLSELSQTIPTHTVPTLLSDDFPSLGSTIKSKPPPGFSKPKEVPKVAISRPPPGFCRSASHNTGAKPPPGFGSTQVDNLENVAPYMMNGKNSQELSFSYIQPALSQERNKQLIQDIQQVLTVQQFDKFKTYSRDFRQDQISGAEYYKRCCDVMDSDSFGKIFPELIVLLPDISKQQVLLAVHQGAKDRNSLKTKNQKKGWQTNSLSLTTCHTCCQVVSSADLVSHMSEHHMDSDFPSLGGVSSTNGVLSSWGKK